MSKTKTPVGMQYVKDFSFPAAQGFTGSAGRSEVKGYMRGGRVKNASKKPKLAKGTTKAAMGGFMGPEREIAVDDVTITVPKMKGGAVHNKLRKAGAKMGYAYGGRVKPMNTSSEFKAKRGKQDTMDDGVQPARRGRNQQEIEAGGTKRLKPGYKGGGSVKKGSKKGGKDVAEVQQRMASQIVSAVQGLKGTKSDFEVQKLRSMAARIGKNTESNKAILSKMRDYAGVDQPVKKAKGGYMGAPTSSGGGALADAAIKGAKAAHRARPRKLMKRPEGARKASAKGMPKNVKAKGGEVHYSQGGVIKKA